MGLKKPDLDIKILPRVSNPAGAENIQAGFKALDSNGVIIEGTLIASEVVTGNVSAKEVRTVTITDAIGKENIVLYASGSTASNYYVFLRYINGVGSGKQGGSGSVGTVTWDKTTGTISGQYGQFSNGAYFVAW